MPPMHRKLVPFLCLLGLTLTVACHHPRMIRARSEYLNPGYLASSHIETPDPCRGCFTGQQVVVSWNVPCRCLPADIELWVRYGDRCFTKIVHPISTPSGFWIYRLIDDDFRKLKGIVAYSAKLTKEGVVLDQWNHHLWADLVEVLDEEAGQVSLLIPEPELTHHF